MTSEADEYIRAARRRDTRYKKFGEIMAVLAGLGLCAGLIFVQCNGCEVGDNAAIETLEAAGMQDAILGGPDVMACGDHESSRHFSATNARGDRVEGTVCCGAVGKGCTIRWGR